MLFQKTKTFWNNILVLQWYLFTEFRFHIIIFKMFQTVTNSNGLKIKLVLLLVFVCVNATILPVPIDDNKCAANQIFTKQLGCIQSCSSAQFKNCGDVFIDLYDPRFCALTRDGRWVSYTFSCQACKNANVVGVGKGACEEVLPVQETKPPVQYLGPPIKVDPVPPVEQPPKPPVQYLGPPIKVDPPVQQPSKPPVQYLGPPIKVDPPLPGTPVCGENEVYVEERGCIRSCTDPYFQTCKDLMFIQIIDLQYCGFTKDGSSKSATFECQICGTYPDTEFIGVSKGKCKQDIADCKEDSTCQPYQFCDNGKCNDKCALMDCLQTCEKGTCITNIGYPKCQADDQCLKYEKCDLAQGVCVEACPGLKCEYGCAYGECLGKPCKQESDCRKGEFCHPNNFVCTNWCVLSKCPYGCVDGNCNPAPVPGCKTNADCKQFEFCNPDSKTCLNNCALAKCAYGCVNGACNPPPAPICKADTDCQKYEFCLTQQGKCLDKCALMRCMYKCEKGACLPLPGCKADSQCQSYQLCLKDTGKCIDRCSTMKCVNGCEKGKCLPPKPECTKDSECKSNQICKNEKCILKPLDVCAIIKCGPGTHCEKGQCVPNVQKCKVNEECADPQICLDGVCFNRCKTTKCPGGYFCQHGDCFPEPRKCKADKQCGMGEKCWNGICQDKCVGLKCWKGSVCFQGACVPDVCPKSPCPEGTFCKDSKCVPAVYACPAKSQYKVTTCIEPRPNEKKCPVLIYIRAPDPVVCGVTAKGEYVNFARDCQACKDKGIVYYYDKPCHELPFICDKQQSCNEYYCSGKCSSDEECPYDWQMCLDGKCFDRCASMRCAAPCKFGQCGYKVPSGKCSSDKDCGRDDWSCVAFKCVDLCLNKRCPHNSTCNKGECQPLA